MSDHMLDELRKIIEKDKVFINSEFLAFYGKCLFGVTEPLISKRVLLLLKEFRNFMYILESKEKTSGVKILSLDPIEREILKGFNKIFTGKEKTIDPDVLLDKFKEYAASKPKLNTIDAEPYIHAFTQKVIIDESLLNIIEDRFNSRKTIYKAVEQYNVLFDFVMNGYNTVTTLKEYKEKLNVIMHETLRNISSFDLDNTNLVDMTEQQIEDIFEEEQNKYFIPTRYSFLDYVFNGGLEGGRLYVFAGISGGGKSLVLGNLAYTTKISLDEEKLKTGNKESWTVLYISLENSAIETRTRFVCTSLGVSKKQIIGAKMIGNMDELKNKYNEIFNDDKTHIKIVWKRANSMTPLDILSLKDNIENKYNTKVKAIFLDYADKLLPPDDSKSGVEWQDLGKIFDELKNISVDLDIPVATVTQMNKEGYKGNPGSTGVAGSMRKRDNADVVVMFDFAVQDESMINLYDYTNLEQIMKDNEINKFTPVIVKIDKNRDGIKNVKFTMYIDYSSYRMVDNLNTIDSLYYIKETNNTDENVLVLDGDISDYI